MIITTLLPMSEGDVDALLEAVGSPRQTIEGWGDRLRPVKRLELARILGGLSDDQISDLIDVLAEDAPPDSAIASLVGELVNEPPSAYPRDIDGTSLEHAVDPDGPIFVVHGRDHTILHHLVRVLERITGRQVIVLHEQANSGKTILEKFEDHAAHVAYAVVLLTGDDEGRLAGEADYRRRGRQNVVFELGFFYGKLGRERVAVLLDVDVERPSDIEGVIYIQIDSAGAWKHALAKELKSANIEVDYGRMP